MTDDYMQAFEELEMAILGFIPSERQTELMTALHLLLAKIEEQD